MIFNMNGGGTALNFRVVGGTSTPSDPKENTVWVNTDTTVSSWDFSATQPARRSNNKNLIVYPYSSGSTTANGITWTVNSDGTVMASGTATAKTNLNLTHKTDIGFILSLPAGTYRLSGCPTGGSTSTYYIEAAVSYDNWNSTSAYPKDTGSGTTITLSAPAKVAVYISIISGARVSGIVFKPQLEAGSTATSFVKGDATGQVWISTGTTSPSAYNALKKNGIQVYPIYAKQYVNGAWVDKPAKTYQGVAWVEWMNPDIAKIYNLVERRENGTGGATVSDRAINFSSTSNASGQQGYVCWYSAEKIDVSGYTTLTFKATRSSFGQSFRVGFRDNNTSSWTWQTDGMVAYVDINNTNETTYTLNISSLSSSYYFFAGFAGETSSGTATMKLSDFTLT